MQVLPILHELIAKPLDQANIRKTKNQAIIDMTTSLINQSQLTLTSLGRHMQGNAYVKHKIKRVDRWLGNQGLYDQLPSIYHAVFTPLLLKRKILYILVDWSGCCNQSECCLRASLVYEGRSITFYQEVHSTYLQQKPYIHRRFLNNLKSIIPSSCRVTLITDRGFQSSWFKSVQALGWDFIGRVSKSHCIKLKNIWMRLDEVYKTARNKPQYLGSGQLGKKSTEETKYYFYSYKETAKNRKSRRVRNKPFYSELNESYSNAHKAPWILITSISPEVIQAKEVVKNYSYRMQIEQNFRDDKNERWGFGMQYNRSSCKKRIAILLLIAAIASYVLLVLGVTAENQSLHRGFQANTKKTRVLSFIFLAKQVMKHFSNPFNIKDLRESIELIAEGVT